MLFQKRNFTQRGAIYSERNRREGDPILRGRRNITNPGRGGERSSLVPRHDISQFSGIYAEGANSIVGCRSPQVHEATSLCWNFSSDQQSVGGSCLRTCTLKKCKCANPVTPSMHRNHFIKTTGGILKNAGAATTFNAMNKKHAANCTLIHPRMYVSSVAKTEN